MGSRDLARTFVFSCLSRLRNTVFFFLLGALLSPTSSTQAQEPLLTRIIVLKNQVDLERSLQDGSYRGEAGILRMKPEVAESFGMRVFSNQDYRDAMAGFARAEAFLDRAKAAMISKETEPQPGRHAKTIADNYLRHRHALGEATQALVRYRERLALEPDDRRREDVCAQVLERLLGESLKKAETRLRDSLGHFYNACRGNPGGEPALTPENVEFVNQVFNHYKREAAEEKSAAFHLDRIEDYRPQTPWVWKPAFPHGFPYTSFIEDTVQRLRSRDCEVDPLLFLALLRRESNFDASAVSHAGAVGLTQIMPGTALDLGVRTVFYPDYMVEVGALLDQERKARAQAMEALSGIRESNKIEFAAKARSLMQRTISLSRQREKLLRRYRKDLLEGRADDRLNPSVAIDFGYGHFCALMKEHAGDISLALAAYNAGTGRVKEYNGIPPFGETVRFRNRVLEYYREYLRALTALDH
jgi:soluble lytic murein transglycosylase-like protein